MLSATYRDEITRRLQAEKRTKTALMALCHDLADQRTTLETSGVDVSVFTLRLRLLKARVAGGSLSLNEVEKELDLLLTSLAEAQK